MSMLRCFYGRVKFVKCQPGSSISLKVCDPSSSRQFVINLNARHLNGMTFTEKKFTSSRNASAEANKSDVSLLRNGLMLDNVLRNTSFTEGYYRRTDQDQRNHGQSSQTNDEKANSKCEFNMNSINVRLLETFGFLGTAVAVGIDVRSRINEWMPYQNRRGIHDLCQYHHHHHNSNNPLAPSINVGNVPSSVSTPSSSLSRVLGCFNKQSTSTVCAENDPCLTTIRYCGSCNICSGVFDKLLHLYITAFPQASSSPSSILNILPSSKTSSTLPKVGYSLESTESSQEESDETDEDEIYLDEVDGPSIDSFLDNQLQFDSTSISSGSGVCHRTQSPQPEEIRQAKQDVSSRQRKKSVFLITENESEQLQELASKSSHSSQSDYISVSESASSSQSIESSQSSIPEVSTDSGKSDSFVKPELPKKKVSEDKDDMATVFRIASMEYADQLNNLVAISLMRGNRPSEAMQCWSSCETSSRAFFNMGVAYETGRHKKHAKPDLDRAHDCYALAASMGHRDAIFNLALFYLYGKGNIAADEDRGIEMLEAAAAKGVEAAQNYIAQVSRQQLLDEIRENLQRKQSTVDNVKRRPLRTSFAMRPSASMFGSTATRLRPKPSTSGQGAIPSSNLKRTNSAPDLSNLSPIAMKPL